ncbi:DUF4184 family protein [Microbacterium sp. 18062]|uniref:DUF4184 family protein n=1 Tax=Microbacterium sp. 18062 TaxID=2681410 RepID=UPI00135A6D57|nr:DUF4184 family protein [Microbacterium sp. 18062]
MPFTPSHAIVALPFLRTRLVAAAIAVGAMTPDLPLFVRGTPLSYVGTHDLRWLPATIVLALGLLLVWRCVLRPAVRELSPRALAARLPVSWDARAAAGWRETLLGGWRSAALLVASLAIGVASHVLWDAFAHEGRLGTELVPLLDERWGPLVGYKWVQHGSSAIGLAVLAIWALLWVRGRGAVPVRRVLPDTVRLAWWLSLPLALALAWIVGLAAYGPLTDGFTVAHLAYRALPPACAAWGVLTLMLSVATQVARARR